MSMTPQEFAAKWRRVSLSERSASHQHFLDLCEVLRQPKPAAADPDGSFYTFEKGATKTSGGDGWADVWMRGHFAWEYKGKHRDLKAAYKQLLDYREALENPPLLVVCDMDRFEVHTNFTGTAKVVYQFSLEALAAPSNLDVLRRLFTDPESLRPEHASARITEDAVGRFNEIADGMRSRGVSAREAAHFLTKLVFCFFAEDIGLLPGAMFTRILERGKSDPDRLSRLLSTLFEAMSRGGDFGAEVIAHFNGGLFADAEVVSLTVEETERLVEIGQFAWEHVEPSIFGTLFERLLDPAKRTQIGAHYTSRSDIETLVEPVLMAPLRDEWKKVNNRCEELREEIDSARTPATRKRKTAARGRALQDFVERVAHVRVLDPACGAGNFLYVAITRLLDLEKEVITYASHVGIGLIPHVHPRQLFGIEVNPYARELASAVIWIGYLQWMHHNGFSIPNDPILEPLESILGMDAILDLSNPERPREPAWPTADVIVSNPPFLGGKLLRSHLGDAYVDALFLVWNGRLSREADLCCYWFEKSRAAVERGQVDRVGLLATQGIRGGANARVLRRILETADIFFAVSDRRWVLEGANVHVSMVGFASETVAQKVLNGRPVTRINTDLSASTDLTAARRLPENAGIAFMGDTKGGAFDVPPEAAERLLEQRNPTDSSNSEVVVPWVNGKDVTQRPRSWYIIDFGSMSEEEAAVHEAPFEYVLEHVKPNRDRNKRAAYRKFWWRHVEPRPEMRRRLGPLTRFIVTPTVSKHRLFQWIGAGTLPDHQLIVFARDDDFFFGVLHSSVHERWARRKGTQLREAESGFRYTPTTVFETFPFPPLAGGIASEVGQVWLRHRRRIGSAAAELHRLREAWLNPDAVPEAELKRRTLTNLYNKRPRWLELAHLQLDRSVLAAYGWPEEWAEQLQPRRASNGEVDPSHEVQDPDVEEEVLVKLLALNVGEG